MTEVYWIYHERQEAALCGQHALNNLVQQPIFSAHGLAEIAHHLDALELRHYGDVNSPAYLKRLAEGSGNVDAAGNFSIEVLRAALKSQFDLSLVSIQAENLKDVESTEIDGFIFNRAAHWFAIRKINGLYWNLDSMKDKPEAISHFRLAATVAAFRNEGYSVFLTEGGRLPAPWKGKKHRDVGRAQFWWKETNLRKGKDVVNGATDPWAKVQGKGNTLGGSKLEVTDDMDPEMQLQIAISKSLAPQREAVNVPLLSPEPEKDEPNTFKIRLKLPNGKPLIRRFRAAETLGMIHAVVFEVCGSPTEGKVLELRAGFPPKVLSGDRTLSELKGASVTCQWVSP